MSDSEQMDDAGELPRLRPLPWSPTHRRQRSDRPEGVERRQDRHRSNLPLENSTQRRIAVREMTTTPTGDPTSHVATAVRGQEVSLTILMIRIVGRPVACPPEVSVEVARPIRSTTESRLAITRVG